MVYSLYVRFKVKKFYREHETTQLGEDIAIVLSKLQALFELKVDDSADTRTMESQFVFKNPVPWRTRSNFFKSTTRPDDDSQDFSESASSSAAHTSVPPLAAATFSENSSSAKICPKKPSCKS